MHPDLYADARPPRWLILSTIAFTLLILAMAVAETNLWMHFLVDRGEYISVAGVVCIALVGLYLHGKHALRVSLPLFIPWLLYPVVTQGDQLIDNLTINQMRLVCHVILAVIFGGPMVVTMHAIHNFWPAISARQSSLIIAGFFLLETWVAYAFLGWYMIATLAILAAGYLVVRMFNPRWTLTESLALKLMVGGVVISLGLFFGFKNRPGAYQGSPAAFLDPTQQDSIYNLTRIAVPAVESTPAIAPAAATELGSVLAAYGDVLKGLVHAYWLMDRNYNYQFHNELFWRSTPLVPEFRTKALQEVLVMRSLARVTDERAATLRTSFPENSQSAVLFDEVREFVAFNLRRATMVEEMTAGFIKTKAGVQHATHLCEGEAKLVSSMLGDLVKKHDVALERLGPLTASFRESSRQVFDQYANRIVGF